MQISLGILRFIKSGRKKELWFSDFSLMFEFAWEELVNVIEFVDRVEFHFTLTCFWNLEKSKTFFFLENKLIFQNSDESKV